ncbi:MAG: hypothetical protein ACRD4K_16110 [Candidatus Acidiferrales bacterium]
MARVTLEQAYPGIEIRPNSRNWWAWLKGTPAECIHMDHALAWMATLVPDVLYLRGKAATRRQPRRPEISLCRPCLFSVVEGELASYSGRIVAFEPDPDLVSQYFFAGTGDFEAVGLQKEVRESIEQRLAQPGQTCQECSRPASWLWFSRDQVETLDDVAAISAAPGDSFCSAHGAEKFCRSLANIPEANLFYMNLPYGDTGAYVWI